MKPLSLEEIDKLKVFGFNSPEDWARMVYTARLAHQMKTTLESYSWAGQYTEAQLRGNIDAKARKALALWDK